MIGIWLQYRLRPRPHVVDGIGWNLVFKDLFTCPLRQHPIALEGGAEGLFFDSIFPHKDFVNSFGSGVINLTQLRSIRNTVSLRVDQIH